MLVRPFFDCTHVIRRPCWYQNNRKMYLKVSIITESNFQRTFAPLLGSLSNRQPETGRERFVCHDSGVSQIFILIISDGEKILSNVNVVVRRQVKRENGALPVAVRVSKTRVLKLPNVLSTNMARVTSRAIKELKLFDSQAVRVIDINFLLTSSMHC